MAFPHAVHIDDPIRREQVEEARRMAESEGTVVRRTLSVRPGYENRSTTAARKAPVRNQLKGHEAFLKALELSGVEIELEKTDGTLYRGRIKHADKYTMTINVTAMGHVENTNPPHAVDAPRDRVVFKHDISEFSALAPRVERRPVSEEGTPA